MQNKYVENCAKCLSQIAPFDGEFIERDRKYRIVHKTCNLPNSYIPLQQKDKWASQEVYKLILNNRFIFYKLINKKLSSRFNRKPYFIYQSVPYIFQEAFDKFVDKYHDKSFSFEISKKILFKICEIQVLVFMEKQIDEEWFSKLSKAQKNAGLKPPSFFYHKKYLELNREKINKRRRENYQNVPKLKLQRKEKYMKNTKHNANTTTEELRVVWNKSTYVKTLEVIHNRSLQKPLNPVL